VLTKSLSQQRLLVLMHECGFIFIRLEKELGEQHQRQVERHGNQRQLQQMAKTILRMKIAGPWAGRGYGSNVVRRSQKPPTTFSGFGSSLVCFLV